MKRAASSRRLAADHEETDSEGSWAVSYGDLVTLLLCFFILFFSIEPQNKKAREEKAKQDEKKQLLSAMISAFEQSNSAGAPSGAGQAPTRSGAQNGAGQTAAAADAQNGAGKAQVRADLEIGGGKTQSTAGAQIGGGQAQGKDGAPNGAGQSQASTGDLQSSAHQTTAGMQDEGGARGPAGTGGTGGGAEDAHQKDGGMGEGSRLTSGPDQESKAKGQVSAISLGREKAEGAAEELLKQINGVPEKWGDRIVIQFPAISFFGSGQTELTPEGRMALQKFVQTYLPYAGVNKLVVRAFTDMRPVKSSARPFRDNLELSALRSVAAMRVLRDSGIPLNKMRLGGYGEFRTSRLEGELETLPQDRRPAAQYDFARKVILIIEPEEADL